MSDLKSFQTVSLDRIDRDNTLTDFSLGDDPESLLASILEIGVSHPVTLIPAGATHAIVCGHRRVRLAVRAQTQTITARVLAAGMNAETLLATNLCENRGHRRYSDIEKGGILLKLRAAGIPEDQIIQKYMPIIELERSKKLFQDFIKTKALASPLKALLHKTDVPLRHFQILLGWDTQSLHAGEELFSILSPGANKWRDLLELIADISRRDDIPPAQILQREDLRSELLRSDVPKNEKYDRVHQILHAERFPVLDDLQKKQARAIDQLALDSRTKVRTPKNFESEEIRIELRFTREQELVQQLAKLERAAIGEPLSELLRLFRK